MKHEVMPGVVGALGTVPQQPGQVELKINGRIETILTAALLRSARILRRVRRPKETCFFIDSSERQATNAGVKNLQRVK